MGQIQSRFLSIDEVMTYFEFKIGSVSIHTALRRGHLKGKLIDNQWYFDKKWIEKRYTYPIENPTGEVRFITPKDLLEFYFPEMSMSTMYKRCNEGIIPFVRVGSKMLILKCELEDKFKRPYLGT